MNCYMLYFQQLCGKQLCGISESCCVAQTPIGLADDLHFKQTNGETLNEFNV
jgi:hypothetical protein